MIKVSFDATNSGMHGSPGTVMEKTYESSKDIAHIPVVGEEIILQYGNDLAQSATFKVEKIDKQFWKDSDVITVWVKNIE